MPSFGKKGGNTIEETMAALEGPLLKFHEACEGDLEAIAELFHAMSGQALPPPVLCQIMNVPPEIVQAASRENPIKISSAQLLGGVAAALDEGDSAAMYFDKIEACAARVSERKEIKKLRFAITLDESTALDMESRLLNNMKNDTMMLEHLAGIKDLHDKWRENSDVEDASRFPTIVVGPQVLSFEGMSADHHAKLLNPTEREQFFLRPGEGCVGLLREKLAPLRRSNPSVGQAQRQRIAWLVTQATGVVVSEEALGNIEGIAALDSKLAAEVSSEVFQKTIDDLLGDVKLGPSSVRIDAVETEISKAIGRAASSMPVPIRGYDAVVLHASLRAITEENYVGDFSPTDPPPIAASLTAVKKTRRKIGDRFFRKKWLPLESNPDIFNQLGAQLGLPTSEVEFYEVFGMDAELLAMLPAPSYALLVCFPLTPVYRKAAGEAATSAEAAAGPYFMHQTIPNACGTVALIHAYANLPNSKRSAGVGEDAQKWLSSFVAKTRDLDASARAAALENDEALATAHNSMAQQGDTNVAAFQAPSDASNAFHAVLHFVCYVHHEGVLYELDGLKKGPVSRGPTTQDDFLKDSVECVKQLLAAGDTDELRVNLMVLSKAAGTADSAPSASGACSGLD